MNSFLADGIQDTIFTENTFINTVFSYKNPILKVIKPLAGENYAIVTAINNYFSGIRNTIYDPAL